MSQPTLNEKAAATIEDLELMASLHRTNGDDAAAEEFDDFGMVVRQLVAENEALRKDGDRREVDGYINGLTYAGNMKPRIAKGEQGAMVLNDIRAQIDEAIDGAAMGKGEQP